VCVNHPVVPSIACVQKTKSDTTVQPLTNLFVPDAVVDAFKLAHPTTSHGKGTEDCKNDFAAEKTRPPSKNLFSSAICMSLCAHAYPLKGASMRLGEKFAYCHVVLMELIKAKWCPAFLEYDIACRFHAYLKKYEPELLTAMDGLHAPHMTSAMGATILAGIKLVLGELLCMRIPVTRSSTAITTS
jgi:hypothetical protein